MTPTDNATVTEQQEATQDQAKKVEEVKATNQADGAGDDNEHSE